MRDNLKIESSGVDPLEPIKPFLKKSITMRVGDIYNYPALLYRGVWGVGFLSVFTKKICRTSILTLHNKNLTNYSITY